MTNAEFEAALRDAMDRAVEVRVAGLINMFESLEMPTAGRLVRQHHNDLEKLRREKENET